MKELYFENANGQMEINFEALELLTSEAFVREIKDDLKIDTLLDVTVKDRDGYTLVDVITGTKSYIHISSYYKSKGDLYEKIDSVVIGIDQLERCGFVKKGGA